MSIDLTGKPLTESLLGKLSVFGFCHIDGVPTSNDDAACQAAIDSFTLGHYLLERKLEVDEIAKRLRDSLVAGVSAGELSLWPEKLAQARAYKASNNEALAPLLTNEASYRNMPVQNLVQIVLDKAATQASQEAAISGVAGRHKDQISALTSWEAAIAYDITTSWPVF